MGLTVNLKMGEKNLLLGEKIDEFQQLDLTW